MPSPILSRRGVPSLNLEVSKAGSDDERKSDDEKILLNTFSPVDPAQASVNLHSDVRSPTPRRISREKNNEVND